MELHGIPFCTTDWSRVEAVERPGLQGSSRSRVRVLGDLRVRMVEYGPGYVADHWCRKGHVLLCLEGRLETELQDGRVFILGPGTSYQVADGAEPHRSRTQTGARLFIVD
ncbi:MAG: DHCW motif cupin fold protein [Holophagaceae bacterium]